MALGANFGSSRISEMAKDYALNAKLAWFRVKWNLSRYGVMADNFTPLFVLFTWNLADPITESAFLIV